MSHEKDRFLSELYHGKKLLCKSLINSNLKMIKLVFEPLFHWLRGVRNNLNPRRAAFES